MQEVIKLKKWIKTAKTTIFLVAVLTFVNTLLIAFNSGTVFTFSAYIPQLVVYIFADAAADLQVKNYLYIGAAIAILISLVYLALWLGAKKKDAMIAAALVLFSIDTAVLLLDVIPYFDFSYIIDILFHGWVIFDLVMGVCSCSKLRKMSVQDNFVQQNSAASDFYTPYSDGAEDKSFQNHSTDFEYEPQDNAPLRISENKGRVIMSAEYNGMNVEVRRSKGLTELIVNGKVYAEKKGVIETEYTICARVSGVEFSTTMTMQSVMFLFADGKQIAKKIRMI